MQLPGLQEFAGTQLRGQRAEGGPGPLVEDARRIEQRLGVLPRPNREDLVIARAVLARP